MASLELPSAGQPICVWTEASRKFAIHLHPEIIGRLGTESWIAFKRVPRRGLEIGGILLGRTNSDGDATTFWIDGFLPIESEHRSGPSYVLSESDFGRLRQELKKNGSASIGIYRSQTRSEQLALQEPDVELFDRCFDTGSALFLMLGPVPGVAAFFTRTDGNLKCVHEFPLASSLSAIVRQNRSSPDVRSHPEPAKEARSAPASSVRERRQLPQPETNTAALDVVKESDPSRKVDPPAVSAAAASPPVDSRPSYSAPAGSARPEAGSIVARGNRLIKLGADWWRSRAGMIKGKWILAAALASFLAAIALNVLSQSRRPVAPVAPAPESLHLTVERVGSSLRLLWDRDSSAIRGTTRAILHIQDGDQRSDRELAASEFNAGSITYEPKSSELTFRLDVYSADPHATGSLQVVNLSAGSNIPSVPAVTPDSKPSPRIRSRTQVPLQAPVAKAESALAPTVPTQSAKAEVSSAGSGSVDRPKEEVRTVSFSPPDRTGADLSNARAVSAPVSVQTSPQPSPLAVNRPAEPPRDIPPTNPAPSVWVSTEPVSGSRLGQLAGKIPLVRRLRKPVNATSPVPLYQAPPLLRMSEQQRLNHEVLVDVKVYVGESGSVNDAEVVEYGDPTNLSLANAALAAARQWTFAPARQEDGPVAGELLLHFHFNP